MGTRPFAAGAVRLGLLASLFVLLTVACSDAGLSPLSREARAQQANGRAEDGFRLAQSAQDEVRGSLQRPDIPVTSFSSEVANAREATSAGDEFAVTRVEAGTLAIEAKRNLRTGSITAGGHGDRITSEQQGALLALCKELEGRFGNLGGATEPEEDQLVRITCYYAEAPVGHELTRQTETPEESREKSEDSFPQDGSPTEHDHDEHVHAGSRPDVVNPPIALASAPYRIDFSDGESGVMSGGCARLQTLEDQGRLEGDDFTAFVACQRADNDGITYLTCKTRNHNLSHDSNVDCFHTRSRPTGPCVNNCTGRCGPGCGFGQHEGVYTRDCAEHDDCLTDHPNCDGINGNDRCCGDEFDDAFGDTIRGNQNCSGARCS